MLDSSCIITMAFQTRLHLFITIYFISNEPAEFTGMEKVLLTIYRCVGSERLIGTFVAVILTLSQTN